MDHLTDNFLQLRKFVTPEHVFGPGARFQAVQYCKMLGVKKLFFVSDVNLKNMQWVKEIELLLQKESIEYIMYSSVSPNPRDFEVMNGANLYTEKQCNMILAIGGGSVIDCAKGIGIVCTNKKRITAYEGVDKIKLPMPPLISIPTTAGSSADVSQFAIINKIKDRYKMAIISKALISDVALIDPVILTSMDPLLTACTGVDALSHAFEAYVSNASSTITNLFALEAIRLINTELLNSMKEPENIETRGKVMLGSLYAGLAFSNASLGCVHSLAHSLGGYLDLPHGECNAILLPHVVNYNFSAVTEKYTAIAQAMNLNTSGLSSSEIKNKLIEHLFNLNKSLGIVSTLKDRGVTSDLVPVLAKNAINDPCNATNPVPPTADDLKVIYSEAI
ncbi:alcohol dehydrogenase-like regulatory protein ErcA [uncultured Draconibacterium sp.]|uniref:alcohol dehydrogenase-like regulatory protein ErcA n=1 Tax=uncultured Draconibacterium sp. TaxID=1573823 RepID=UPI0032165A3A